MTPELNPYEAPRGSCLPPTSNKLLGKNRFVWLLLPAIVGAILGVLFLRPSHQGFHPMRQYVSAGVGGLLLFFSVQFCRVLYFLFSFANSKRAMHEDESLPVWYPSAKQVRLAYYVAADGARLILFGPMDVDLSPLKECFAQLGGQEGIVDLESLPFVHGAVGVKMRLQSLKNEAGFHSRLRPGVHAVREGGPAFQWTRTCEEWKEMAGLIEKMQASKGPCHQYFPQEASDDAKVVLSKGEYGDDGLKGTA